MPPKCMNVADSLPAIIRDTKEGINSYNYSSGISIYLCKIRNKEIGLNRFKGICYANVLVVITSKQKGNNARYYSASIIVNNWYVLT